MRRRGQGQCLWPGPGAGHGHARQGRLQDVLRGRSCGSTARTRAGARRHDLCARRLHAGRIAGLRRAQCPAGHQQHDRACRVGRLRRRPQLARRRGAAGGHRHEPARHFAGRSRRAGAAHPDRKSRHHAVDESLGLRRDRRPSAHREPDQTVSRTPRPLSRHSGLARQFLRHFPRRLGTVRSGAAWGRALRRQSDARPAQSDARRRRA